MVGWVGVALMRLEELVPVESCGSLGVAHHVSNLQVLVHRHGAFFRRVGVGNVSAQEKPAVVSHEPHLPPNRVALGHVPDLDGTRLAPRVELIPGIAGQRTA